MSEKPANIDLMRRYVRLIMKAEPGYRRFTKRAFAEQVEERLRAYVLKGATLEELEEAATGMGRGQIVALATSVKELVANEGLLEGERPLTATHIRITEKW